MSRVILTFGITRRFSSKPSYFHNPGKTPLVYRNVGQQLEISTRRFPNREAIVACSENERLTFADLDEKVSRLGAGFVKLGLQPGDAIAIWGPNYLHWAISMLAAARSGLVTVGINPNFQASEVKYSLNKVGVKALVASETYRNTNYYTILEEIIPELKNSEPGKIKSESVPSLRSLIIPSTDKYNGAFKFCDMMDLANKTEIESLEKNCDNISPDAPCNIQFTSGTTGLPKAAVLSHNGLVNSAETFTKALNLEDARICGILPLFHCYALLVGKLAAIVAGATYVIPSPYFIAEKALKTVVEEKCTHLQGTPTMYVDLVEKQKELKLPITTLKHALTGGASCSPQFINDIRDVLKIPAVRNAYGASETSANAFIQKFIETEENNLTTVGSLNEHLEAKVIDPNGKTLPFGQLGELCIRGYNIMLEYYGDEEKTREVLDKDRWYKTGDQFILREDGHGIIAGRIKEMIIRGGENLFPKEIEDFLNAHPDIIESHVIGVPDRRLGEEMCAFVRVKEGAELNLDVLKQYCKGKIAHFKIPRYLRIVKEFPKTTSGKIQKFKLKEMYESEEN
ncbi:ACSF2.2 family protein [Megaselia abdita]